MADERDERYESYLNETQTAGKRKMILGGAGFLVLTLFYGVYKSPDARHPMLYCFAIVAGLIALLLANMALDGKRPTGARDAKIAAAVAAVLLLAWICLH